MRFTHCYKSQKPVKIGEIEGKAIKRPNYDIWAELGKLTFKQSLAEFLRIWWMINTLSASHLWNTNEGWCIWSLVSSLFSSLEFQKLIKSEAKTQLLVNLWTSSVLVAEIKFLVIIFLISSGLMYFRSLERGMISLGSRDDILWLWDWWPPYEEDSELS